MDKEILLGLLEYEEAVKEKRRAREELARRLADQGMTLAEYFRIRRARQRAEALGLAYWPALAFGPKIDPWAYVIADRVLAEKAGARYGETTPDGTVSHGGWDSCGHHGLSPAMVASMWYAAGCRDGGKYRLQVASGVLARKGDTLPWLRNYVRGHRWLVSNRLWLPLSRKAIAVLGRLSPELRWAAVRSFDRNDVRGVIRVRDLDWDAVRRTQEMLRGGSPRARAAVAGLRRAAQLLGVEPGEAAVAAALAPAYPNLPLPYARRIALGESPVQLSGGALTRREAHEWCVAGAPAITEWLADHLGVPRHRSIKVIRWLAHCRQSGRWPALERQREVRLPGGEMRIWSVIDVLDEIQDEDVYTDKDSVDAVIRRAAQRKGEAWLDKAMQDHRILAPLPHWAQKLPRGVRILRTPSQLAREGREMSHCVGGYAQAVERGQCHILAISTRHGRSTVELAPHNLTVVQHRGPNNVSPPRRNEALLRAFLARVNRQERR